jgi:hypothetical protein
MARLLKYGPTYLFAGARRGSSPLAALGAAMTIIGWLRSRRGPERTLIYSRTLKDGEAVTIRLRRGDSVVAQQDVEG